MRKTYVVTLNPEERANLEQLVSTGRTSAKRQTHGRILLKADAGLAGPGWTDEQICTALDVSPATVARVRKRFVEEGLEAITHPRKARRPARCRLDGRRRPGCWPWPVAPLPKGTLVGLCASWPTGWWSWSMWSRFLMRLSAAC